MTAAVSGSHAHFEVESKVVRGYVTVVEPKREEFADALFVLLDRLCVDAEADRRSPRYIFAFADWDIVEPVRRRLIELPGSAEWYEDDPRIRTPSGQVVMAGRVAVGDWPFERAVVVCSGDYPHPTKLRGVSGVGKVILVFDPVKVPTRADELRRLPHQFVV